MPELIRSTFLNQTYHHISSIFSIITGEMDLNKTLFDLTIIGGGPAGFFCAISCLEKNPTLKVCIIEKGYQLLSKVLVSGGGRCNVTNACFDPAQLVLNYPRGGKALRGPFTRFQPRDTIKWFESRGVLLKTEQDGRVFPASDSAKTIQSCLVRAAQDLGANILSQSGVEGIQPLPNQSFQILLNTGTKILARKVLLATGGSPQAYPLAESLGHSILAPAPSLFSFNIHSPLLEGLSGLSIQDAEIQLAGTKFRQRGPVLITHWGLSGPAVLKLSAWGARVLFEQNYQANLLLNWLPTFNQDSLFQRFLSEKDLTNNHLIQTTDPTHTLPRRIWKRLIDMAGISNDAAWHVASKNQLNALSTLLTRTELKIQGKGEFKEEFVTCGGVDLKEINFKTMESKICQGIYFAGELLDIDGVTGGFNFQNAWTTGWIAGQAIAEALSA